MSGDPEPRLVELGVDDVDALAALAAASTPHPWSRQQFVDELGRTPSRLTGLRVGGPGGEELAAYVVWWLVVDELEILDVATHPRWRRRGLARQLVAQVLGRGRARGARRAFLEVRAGNLGAQALYRRLGFVDAGRRRGYYSDGEDALLLTCALGPT